MGYGHVGDGNLHLNISAKEYSDELFRQIEPFVYEWTAARVQAWAVERGGPIAEMPFEAKGIDGAALMALMRDDDGRSGRAGLFRMRARCNLKLTADDTAR